jgi:hypothetical protein
VTFLLTDVEGSTALWEEAPEAMRAAHLFGAAEAVRDVIGVPLMPADRARLDPRLAVVRATLGTALPAEWTTGRAMSLEQAITYALERSTRT